jgi:hypothetical protein
MIRRGTLCRKVLQSVDVDYDQSTQITFIYFGASHKHFSVIWFHVEMSLTF